MESHCEEKIIRKAYGKRHDEKYIILRAPDIHEQKTQFTGCDGGYKF
jgi:hypothetical protein